MNHLDPHFSPRQLLDLSTDRLVPASAHAAIADDEAEWHRRFGGAAAASPTVPPSRGGDDPVGKMTVDIVALFRAQGEVTMQYLVGLGWDPAEIRRHGDTARARAARELQQADPIDLPASPRYRRRAGSRRQVAA